MTGIYLTGDSPSDTKSVQVSALQPMIIRGPQRLTPGLLTFLNVGQRDRQRGIEAVQLCRPARAALVAVGRAPISAADPARPPRPAPGGAHAICVFSRAGACAASA